MWSQTDLAGKTGLEPSAISQYENEYRTPSLKNFIKIARALNCSLDELVK